MATRKATPPVAATDDDGPPLFDRGDRRWWDDEADRAASPDPVMWRVYRMRRWQAALDEWGRSNGFDPAAPYLSSEGRRWWAFRDALR